MRSFATIAILLISVVYGQLDEDYPSKHPAKYAVNGRIFGGTEAIPGYFRYMVALWANYISSQGIKFGTFCGASLISDEFVLTAAHCVSNNPVNLKLLFGSKHLEGESEAGRVEMIVPAENIISHEGVHLEHDIALVRLPQKVNFTRLIQPVKLARRNQTNLDDDVAIITGWGGIGSKVSHSDALLYAQVRILPDDVCKRVYGYYYRSSNICLDGTTQSACHGDSGGPAVVVDRENRELTLVGVASYASRKGCDQGEPYAYTRVTSYLDWINKHTGVAISD